MRMHRRLSPLCLAFSVALLPGCGYVPRIPGVTPYRIDIQQGNFISQEMVAQLKPGMSKEQVRLALGTPLLTDIFHADRWDYVYWREKPGTKREQRKLTVFFEDGKLTRLDGDGVAAGATQ
jgi:outer membrane protein assembly factor BamE